MNFLEKMKNQVLIADGAIGTLLYSYGTDTCFEELNLSAPEQIQQIHQAYLGAGADLIQTNSYAANYLKLKRYGLEDSVKEINSAAVKLARSSIQHHQTYVLGTIGGVRGLNPLSIPLDEIKRNFREQLYCLLLEGVDGLLLETYYDLEELETVLSIARKETDIPIIAQVSLQEIAILQNGTLINDALKRLEAKRADVVGVNCRLGPHHMLETLSSVELPQHAFLSAYPNASLPAYIDGTIQYKEGEDYFRKSAKSFLKQGVRLLGGCCGTTPGHIKAFADEVRHAVPILEKQVTNKRKPKIERITIERTNTPLETLVQEKRTIIVELDPPKKLSTAKFFEGARALKDAGVDAITLADNSLATPRIANEALAHIIHKDTNVRPLVHLSCRDRNLIGLQSHLMGLHTLGLHDILAITGDPARVGNFPGASSVFDLSSFELIEMIKQFNEGISPSSSELGENAIFSVGAAFNPHVKSLDKAVARLERKIKAGADYFVSQPVFSITQLLEIHEATKHLSAPIFIGMMPLISSKNAEYLHNEVPGIKITQTTRDRMAKAVNPILAEKEGLLITKELIDAALELFQGIYLVTPFLRYQLTTELTNHIRRKDQQKKEHHYVKSSHH